MRKIFISQPMNGKTEEEIREERNEAFSLISKAHNEIGYLGYSGCPQDHEECELIDSLIQEDLDENHPGLKYLSKSIEMLDDADEVWFLNGWLDARGCRIEYACCVAYGIPVYYLY